MKKVYLSIKVLVLTIVIALSCKVAKAQVFTQGNIAVFVAAAIATNTTGSIIELNTTTATQSPVTSRTIDGTIMPNSLRFSGSASSTAYLTNSNDGSLLAFTGGNTNTAGATNINTILPRGVGSYNAAGTFNLATTYTGITGQQTRSATSINNSTWFIGDQNGFYSNGTSAASPSGNIRSVKAFGGTVYAFTSSATIPPVGIISAPTAGSYTALPGLANGATSRQDFYLISSGTNGAAFDVLYVLDATLATAGTIFKYSLVSGSWTANGTYTTTFGGFGMAAKKNGAGADLFVSTGNGSAATNSVLKLNDIAGYNAAISITTANNVTLFTTATGTVIKGVAFAPVTPTPTVNLSVSSNTGSEAAASVITVTATASAPVVGNQTVSLAVTGTNITAGDYTLSNTTITILNGATTGTVTFTVVDDILVEGTETAVLTISNPSSGIVPGATLTQNITITDNDIANPTVNLSVSSNSGSEAAASVITVTATASAPVVGDQTVSLAVSGTNITAGDYTLSNTTITILNGATTGTVTFTVVDDAVVESLETAVLTISNPSSGVTLGTTLTQNVDITDNETPYPTVNLSVSLNAGSEAAATTITVTATASAPVTGNQTVTLGVSGAGITVFDYILSGTTITILNGATTGTVTFKIRNDAELEGTETVTLTISNPSSAITLGTAVTQNVTITDNVCQPLIRKSTGTSINGSEISAFDSLSKRIYTVAGLFMEYYVLSNTGIISAPTNMPTGFTSPGNNILPNSVAIKNGIVAVGYAIQNSSTLAQEFGVVAFYNSATAAYISQVTVGYLPDMIIFSPDGTKILTANEGEPNSYGLGTSFDPEGSVSIIDISGGVGAATVTNAGFTSFNPQKVALQAAGVRIYGPGATTVAQDVEPEYIAFSGDGTKAYITLQENNAVAEMDIASATILQILPLGLKNHNVAGNGLDASDRDLSPAFTAGTINIQNWPIFGMYQPDAISSFTVAGITYFITANEGDSRNYTGLNEEIRVGAGTYILDSVVFPNATTLKLNQNLGRLQLTNATGDIDNDGDFDQIHALGSRSFSIWSNTFSQIFDSGDQLEQITASESAANFNSDGSSASFDGRSDNKGPEPEAAATGTVNGILYAFIGSERTGDIFVYDISNPAVPVFKQYIDHPADLGVEGLIFVPANQSPTGKALVIASAEVSKTVTVYEFSLIPGSLATVYTTIVATQGNTTSYGDCSGLVAKVAQNNINPTISGEVTAKVWIEASVPTYGGSPFVQRHYEITPTTGATTANGKVTLYFKQAEFDNFNNDPLSSLNLPAGPADAIGIANVRVGKYPGTSNNNSGLPASYTTGPASVINPVDADITYNNIDARWEVTFDVAGFSGFILQTSNFVLPVTLLSFSAKEQANDALVQWKTTNEVNHAYYEIMYSSDGRNFLSAAQRIALSGSGEKNYSFTHTNAAAIANKIYYRLKMVSNSGEITYSTIIPLRFGSKGQIITDVYPNPTKGNVNIITTGSLAKPISLRITDMSGRIMTTKQITFSGLYNINIGNYAPGIYLLDAQLPDGSKQQFKLIKE